ncbi:hypothetical protein CHUAL_007044 [Chamberlinius hualienensis]
MGLAEAVDKLLGVYSHFWAHRDARVEGWLLANSIKPVLFLLTLYFIMVTYGPKWMKNRQPFKLKYILFVYNTSIAVFNYYIFKELITVSFRQRYNWLCEPVKDSTDPDEMRFLAAGHLYFLSKALELLDTMFIILRKKNNQLTFLHVYHHSTMLLLTWIVLRWIPGGSGYLAASVNAFVHIVMYGYYGLSALGPNVAKYLWWKKYLTVIQLIQFFWGCSFAINMFVIGCDYTKWMQYVGVLYTLSYLILFGRFYLYAYGYAKEKNFHDQKTKKLYEDNYESKHHEHRMFNGNSLTYRRAVSTLAAQTSG